MLIGMFLCATIGYARNNTFLRVPSSSKYGRKDRDFFEEFRGVASEVLLSRSRGLTEEVDLGKEALIKRLISELQKNPSNKDIQKQLIKIDSPATPFLCESLLNEISGDQIQKGSFWFSFSCLDILISIQDPACIASIIELIKIPNIGRHFIDVNVGWEKEKVIKMNAISLLAKFEEAIPDIVKEIKTISSSEIMHEESVEAGYNVKAIENFIKALSSMGNVSIMPLFRLLENNNLHYTTRSSIARTILKEFDNKKIQFLFKQIAESETDLYFKDAVEEILAELKKVWEPWSREEEIIIEEGAIQEKFESEIAVIRENLKRLDSIKIEKDLISFLKLVFKRIPPYTDLLPATIEFKNVVQEVNDALTKMSEWEDPEKAWSVITDVLTETPLRTAITFFPSVRLVLEEYRNESVSLERCLSIVSRSGDDISRYDLHRFYSAAALEMIKIFKIKSERVASIAEKVDREASLEPYEPLQQALNIINVFTHEMGAWIREGYLNFYNFELPEFLKSIAKAKDPVEELRGWTIAEKEIIEIFGISAKFRAFGPWFRAYRQERKTRTTSKMTREEAMNILGLTEGYAEGELRKAWRKEVMKCHPDRNPGKKEAEERFKQVMDAYDLLKEDAVPAREEKVQKRDINTIIQDTQNHRTNN